jgi:hypothetical protein
MLNQIYTLLYIFTIYVHYRRMLFEKANQRLSCDPTVRRRGGKEGETAGEANTLTRAQSSRDGATDGHGGCGVRGDEDDHGGEERGEGAGGVGGRAVCGGDRSRVRGSEMMSGADIKGHKQGVERATPHATPHASPKMRDVLTPFEGSNSETKNAAQATKAKDSSKEVGRCEEGGAGGGVVYPDAYFIKGPSIDTCVQQIREADARESDPRTVHRGTSLLSKHGQKEHKGTLAAAHHKASLLPAVSFFVRN